MLTIFVVLALIKMCFDQHKEDAFIKKHPYEEFDEHYYERPPLE